MGKDEVKVKTEIMSYIVILFLLLGGLFGVQIMTFIFGQLGPEAAGLDPGSSAFNTSQSIQNHSLGGLETYAEDTDTQFNTISIAITLILLIGVFMVFWKTLLAPLIASGKSGKAEGNFA